MKKLTLFFLLLLSYEPKAQSPEAVINQFMDKWHKAASIADEALFFGSMTKNCIYLGTDKTEKWTRDEMSAWAAEFFQRESAWSFTPIERDVYFSADQKTVWLHEKLDTWMGVCKGTAVLVLEQEGWKIALYDLSVTIDNDKIDSFLEINKD